MQYIIVLTIVFVIMLLAPFAGAMIYCAGKKVSILKIHQGKVKDARYFGKSFAELVEKNFSSMGEDVIKLSREEEFMDGDEELKFPEEVEKLVICQDKSFYSPRKVKVYHKEIYSGQNIAIVASEVRLRAAYAKKKMVLGAKTKVERWVDAEETLAIYDQCNLGMSASAGKRLCVGKDCRFRRLYAPEILIGQYPGQTKDAMEHKNSRIFEASEQLEVMRNIDYVDQDIADEQGVANITVLSRTDVKILEHIIVKGDVRSQKGVRLCDDATVCGNIFAEEDIYIGRNVVVLGNVFTQGNIYVEENSMIGQRGKISSVIARETVTFEKNVSVFGYVSCERGGTVVANDLEAEERNWEFLPLEEYRTKLHFEDLDEFEKVDEQGFRKEEFLKKVEIKVQAKEIPKSMFFACKALERVELPDSIRNIGPYAFCGCTSLKDITSFADMKVTNIGTSAFEHCEALESAEFPKELETLGGAAFGGCKGIKKVKFAKDSVLKSIGNHCFRGCESIEEVELPDSVEKVGISAFADCKALKRISIPKRCEMEPGIMELKEKPGLQIHYRSLEGDD